MTTTQPINEVYINEISFKRILRSLGVFSQNDWKLWCSQNTRIRKKLRLPLSPIEAYENKNFWRQIDSIYPTYWDKYLHLRKTTKKNRFPKSLKIQSFSIKYQHAKAYRSSIFISLDKDNRIVFNAMLATMLACNAFDACQEFVNKSEIISEIIDPMLANELRTVINHEIKNINSDDSDILFRMNDFINGNHNDILCPARLIKACFTQGNYQISDSDENALTVSIALLKLTDTLLKISDRLFSKYCMRISLRKS